MEKYSEADIAKIINDCEILILPENTSLEDVRASEIDGFHLAKQNSQEVVNKVEEESEVQETDEDFEEMYQNSKTNQNYDVIVSVLKSLPDFSLFKFPFI